MEIKAPSKYQLITIRLLILIGFVTVINFFYWFLDPDLIENKFLYWLLIVSLVYTYARVFYEWYHYWSISVPPTKEKQKDFTVDILTTYFPGEPYDMILNTLEAIQNITYPHTTYLCDEANDPFLIEKCKEMGVMHVTRDNRIDAKAGNINNALRTKATGEICVILDPDHIPQPDFLDPIIPHFSDDEIGFVQIVQSYYNFDESFVAKGAAQQTFQFYGPMMMTMNSYGTVNAIGANCTFRRAALDSIGGHSPGLSEDMHTAMQLFAKGWKSVYEPKVLARGLVPSSLTAYYKQQLKWSRGTLELLVSVYLKLFRKFNWRQKIHFALIPMHYLAGVFYLINFLIPIIALLTATTPWKGNVIFFGYIIIPVIASTFIVRHYVQRWVMEEDERGFHVVGGLLLISTWWVFILGLWYTIIRKKIPYLPTPKDGSDKSSWKIIAPNIVVGLVSIFAIFYGMYLDWTPFTFMMSGFALINAFSMFFTIYFSYHIYKKRDEESKDIRARVSRFVFSLKVLFWRFRHTVYRLTRRYALHTSLLILVISMYFLNRHNYNQWEGVTVVETKKEKVDFSEIIYPNDTSRYVLNQFKKEFSKKVIGVNYKKGNNWYKDNYVLTRKELEKDFNKMKSLNINTIKYQESRIYDKNVLNISKENNIDVVYNFWISEELDFVNDQDKLDKLTSKISKKVRSLSNRKNISAWNIGNDVWTNLKKYYLPSELEIQRENYISWLKKTINEIRKIDQTRIVSLDIEVSSETIYLVNTLSRVVPKIDVFGLIIKDKKYLNEFLEYSKNNQVSYMFNDVKPEDLKLLNEFKGKSLFIRNWQDQYENDLISFDGLLNKNNSFYADNYFDFTNYMNNSNETIDIPPVEIVKPSVPITENWELLYLASFYIDGEWKNPIKTPTELVFEWNLIKYDQNFNPIAIKPLGMGIYKKVKIPKGYEQFRLQLLVKKENYLKSQIIDLKPSFAKSF